MLANNSATSTDAAAPARQRLHSDTNIVAVRNDLAEEFSWPDPEPGTPATVGEKLYDLIAARGWKGARAWRKLASDIAPTVVSGSL